MPYRTSDDKIDGLVITFFNISDLKQLEADLHETDMMHRLILHSCSDVVLRLSTDLTILDFNPKAESLFGKINNEVFNKSFIPLFVPVTVQKKTEKELKKILQEKLNVTYNMQIINAIGEKAVIEWTIQPLVDYQNIPSGLLIISKNGTKP
jgi:PAS domain S-box-containing protein